MKRKLNKRVVALLVSLLVLLMAVVGATVAYIVDRTQEMENTFTPSRVACEVVDEGNYTYMVQNTGDTAAYIRASVLVNWKNSSGYIYAKAPEFTVTPGSGWEKGSDGYFYYTKSVAVGALIPEKLTIQVTTAAPDGDHTLFVEIIASAVQATPEAVNA